MTTRPLWGYLVATTMLTEVLAVTAVIPFLTPPHPGQATGIVFEPSIDDIAALTAISRADPAARIIDIRWRGRLVFVAYENPDFPAHILHLGALHVFDAVAAGCHAGPARRPG